MSIHNTDRGAEQAARGFTLVELLVVIGIILLLVGIIMPSLGKALGSGERTLCASNIGEIAKACTRWSQDGTLHREGAKYTLPSVDGVDESNWGDLESGNPACLWLLLEKEFVTEDLLLCPGAKANRRMQAPPESDGRFVWENDRKTYSYSYISMVNSDDVNARDETQDAGGSLVIIADQNPHCTPGTENYDTSKDANTNSENHKGMGQNVGRLDNSSKWLDTPVTSNDDNIYEGGNNDEGKRGKIEDSFVIP